MKPCRDRENIRKRMKRSGKEKERRKGKGERWKEGPGEIREVEVARERLIRNGKRGN